MGLYNKAYFRQLKYYPSWLFFMSYTRYCKCHFYEGESDHWGLLDRRAFAHKGALPHYTPDATVLPKHLKIELNFDWTEERVWGVTEYELVIQGHDVEKVAFDGINLCISRVLIGKKSIEFENTGKKIILHLKKKYSLECFG